jgi:formylglycine-generating enzyme required for sulfatase activity
VALVIGNGAYGENPLRNPVRDAEAVRDALESCKFEVTLYTNAGKRVMEDAIRAFGERVRGGAVGLFYFAGHGLQVEGTNFLIPIGARLDKESDVPYEGVDVGRVLDNMKAAGNKLNILVLDACRNNPFALLKGWRGVGEKGLAQVKAPTGSLLAYATAPGSTAADGAGEHGLYTQALLEEIKEPGLKLEEAFKKVREKVLEASKGGQTPWESNSTVGDFYFRPIVGAGSGPSEAELEATLWEGVKDTWKAAELEAFLGRFAHSRYTELAQAKLANLRRAPARLDPSGLAEPWKALQRGPLETREEFTQRVAGLPPLKVGSAKVEIGNYEVDAKRLILPIQVETWARPFLKEGRAVLELNREQMRQLLAAGNTASVAIRFEVEGGVPMAGALIISTSAGVFTPGPEPPPGQGAEKNTFGLWELSAQVEGTRFAMVLIPSGSFMMGTSATDHEWLNRSRPIHSVTLKHDFWMGKYPVTQSQWGAVIGNNLSNFKNAGADAPVEMVSWEDVQHFISRLNDMQHEWTFRLPTEAEWEYACRAGTEGEAYGPLDAIAWYNGNSGGTPHPVGLKQSNAFGLYDMIGNVWQWCQDNDGDYPSAAVQDPQGPPSGARRIYRGGGWNSGAIACRSAIRSSYSPMYRFSSLGFRLLGIRR